MSASSQRDQLTLFEGAPHIVDRNSKHGIYYASLEDRESAGSGKNNYHEELVPDDGLLILDRLRDVTQKAVQLEVPIFFYVIFAGYIKILN